MRVLLFANTDWYLYNFRINLAQALQARGDEVTLVSPPGEYVAQLQKLGFEWQALSLSRRGMNPLREVASVWQLTQLYRRIKPEVVHHFTIKCVLYGSLAACLAKVNAVVNSITGLGYVFLPGGVAKNYLRALVLSWYRLLLRGTQVIFTNLDDQTAFLENGLVRPADMHLTLGSGVDMDRFHPQPEAPGEAVIMLPGRMLWDKGVGEFVEAARLLKSQGCTARFVLCGRNDPGNPANIETAQLEEWTRLGLVEWWGWAEDMVQMYGQAHIVCLPSYREGLSRALIEAAACGRAIVTTDEPGCRDAIVAGQTGLLVPVRDANALANALETLLKDSARRQAMGAAGRQLAEEKFSSQKIVAQIMQVYDGALLRMILW